MTDGDYDRKQAELDRLLNDPDVPMEPARILSLLDEISGTDAAGPLPSAGAVMADRALLQ